MSAETPTLVTPRLRLGPHRPENLERLYAWENDPEIRAMSADDEVGPTRERTAELLERFMRGADDQRRFAIYLRADDAFIGFTDVVFIEAQHRRCKLAILIGDKQCWGQGLAREALQEILRYCFEDLRLNRVAVEIYAHNQRSLRLFESLGFVREGTLREVLLRAEPVDEHCYALLRREWEKRR